MWSPDGRGGTIFVVLVDVAVDVIMVVVKTVDVAFVVHVAAIREVWP